MSDTAIIVEQLSKRYRIGGAKGYTRYGSLRDSLVEAAAAPFHKLRSLTAGKPVPQPAEIWALKDVSFEVKQGESLGIIGRNGAGKSTLLKILSRITKPTQGRVTLRGRVGSLLEVGTGFHPELTGRENIFLNGAILGMTRREIERKFDEIVAFAEIEQFLDTAVKFYSSGMYMRLAFSVAAHLEPEILLVDEVLAVGDYAFQKKCLGKMGEVTRAGRTVLFVSHQLSMITTLCNNTILLDEGKVRNNGISTDVVNKFITMLENVQGNLTSHREYQDDLNKIAQIKAVSVIDSSGCPSTIFDLFDPIKLQLSFVFRQPLIGVAVVIIVKRNNDVIFVSFDTDKQPELLEKRKPGTFISTVSFPGFMKAGIYNIDVNIGRLNIGGIDVCTNAISFEIIEKKIDSSKRSYSASRPGVIAANLNWNSTIQDLP